MKKYDSFFYNKVIELNLKKLTAKDISKELGCCRKTILKYLKLKGINYTAVYKPKTIECLNCNKPTVNKKFCSKSCTSTYINQINLSDKRKNELILKKEIALKYKDYKGGQRIKKIAEDNLMLENFEDIKFIGRKRKRILLEQNNKCNSCGLIEWMGKPLTLELDHKDGNTNNNKRDNLECICPNCHSLTNTWRGKNRKDKLNNKNPVTQEEFKNAYLENKNVHKALISLNLAAKGKNYSRMYKALDSYDINYVKQSSKIKKHLGN